MSFPLLGPGASCPEYAVLIRNQFQQSSLWSAERAYTESFGTTGLSWNTNSCCCSIATGKCDECTSYICKSPLNVWGRNADVHLSISWQILLGVCSAALKTAVKLAETCHPLLNSSSCEKAERIEWEEKFIYQYLSIKWTISSAHTTLS